MNILISIIIIAVVATMIIKKYKAQVVLIVAALLLMIAAYLLGYTTSFLPADKSLGNPVFDMYEYIAGLLSKDTANLGLMIMAITGFARYMDHIGASTTLVSLAMKPLGKLNAPYLVGALSFLLCMFMSLFISSASGLAKVFRY